MDWEKVAHWGVTGVTTFVAVAAYRRGRTRLQVAISDTGDDTPREIRVLLKDGRAVIEKAGLLLRRGSDPDTIEFDHCFGAGWTMEKAGDVSTLSPERDTSVIAAEAAAAVRHKKFRAVAYVRLTTGKTYYSRGWLYRLAFGISKAT
jgi:hypothetical protein